MADKKLTELDEHLLASLNNSDKVYIVSAGNSSKFIRVGTLKGIFGEKNKETILDEGGTNEVAASEIAQALVDIINIETTLEDKVDKVVGKGLSTEDYTTTEKNKLANLSEHYKGVYTTLSGLQTAHPTGTLGDYADVDAGPGTDAKRYLWDANEGWLLSSGSGSSPDATELVKGIAEIATDAETQAGTDDARFITALKLATWWTYIKTQVQTFAAKITFTSAPRFSSTTASRILKVDANKDLTSGELALSEIENQPALSVLVNATNASAKPTAFQATVGERVMVRNASNTFAFIQLTANYIADLAISTAKLVDLAITTAKIAANAVTRAKLSQSPANTVIGNPSGSTADPADWEVVDLYGRTATASNYTVLSTDTKVAVTSTAAARTMTIGFAANSVTAGHEILFKDESNGAAGNNITITPNGTDTIEDGTINTNGGVLKIYSDGVSKWWKIYKQ